MQDDQIKSDVELVVHKEKLRKAKPKSGLATPQPEEHGARSVSIEIVSAMPVDDKPFVLVSDKPVEVKPLLDERKNIVAGSIICVEKGVQTNAPCTDRVAVQIPHRVEDRSFVRTPVRCFIGAAVRMHKGKDGHVCQLCVPDITHLLSGHAKQVHVLQRKVAATVEKKKVEAPKYKLIWHRKEVQPPRAVSSRASQEGGRGVDGKQDFKIANMRGAIVDIPPPFRADPHALRITLFEGGG
jgi:hypothetical protein